MKLQSSQKNAFRVVSHRFSDIFSGHKIVFYALLAVLFLDLLASGLFLKIFLDNETNDAKEKLAFQVHEYHNLYDAWKSGFYRETALIQKDKALSGLMTTEKIFSQEKIRKAVSVYLFSDSIMSINRSIYDLREGKVLPSTGFADLDSAFSNSQNVIRIITDTLSKRGTLQKLIPWQQNGKVFVLIINQPLPESFFRLFFSDYGNKNSDFSPAIIINDGQGTTFRLAPDSSGSVLYSTTTLPRTDEQIAKAGSDKKLTVSKFEQTLYLYLELKQTANPILMAGKLLSLILFILAGISAILLIVFYLYFRKQMLNYRILYLKDQDSRDTMENYKMILENQGEGVQIVDADDTVIFSNRMGDEIFGVSTGKLIGRSVAEFMDAAGNKKRLTELNCRKMGISDQYEININSADGKLKTLKVTATPRFDDQGKYIGAFSVFHDTTEFKSIELKLSESDAYLRALIESIPQMIWLKDKDLRFIMANRKFVVALGKKEENEIIGKSDFELVSPERAEAYYSVDSEIIGRHTPYTIREENLVNGEIVWHETTKTAVYNAEDKLIGLSGITTDITERIQQERSILSARDFYRQLFENFPVMVWMTDSNGETSYYNKTYLRFRGTTYDAEIRSGWKNTVRIEQRARLVSLFQENFNDRKNFEAEYEMAAADGNYRWVMDIGQPYNDIDGNFGGYIGVCMDVTEQKTIAAKIIESEERYRDLVENISDVVFRISKDGVIAYVSQVITQITGHLPENLLGEHFSKFIHPDDFPRVQRKFLLTLSTPTQQEEFRLVTPTGEFRWIRAQVHSYNEGVSVAGIQGILTDIDIHKRAQEDLRQSEERFRGIFENAYEGILLADESGHIVDWNSALERMTGYRAADVLMKDINETRYDLLQDDLKKVLPIEKLRENYSAFFLRRHDLPLYTVKRITIQHKSGALISADQVSFIIKSGEVNLLCAIMRDITKETFVEQENLKLSLAIEQSPNIVIITNLNGEIDYTNPAFEELTGYSREEVYGKKTSILKSGVTSEKTYKELWETITRGETWRGEFCNRKKNGELYWELASIRPVRNKNNEFINYLAIKEDITNRKQIEKELVAARDKAEEMNRLKSNFLANMSHELRTPMIGILGYSTMLKEEANAPAINNIGEIIFRSGNRLLDTLNLILDFSRLEAQRVEVQLEELNVCEPVREILAHFNSAAALKELDLNVHFSHEQIIFTTDLKLLQQIITNILNNAIKYTHKGSIDIQCDLETNDDERNLIIAVKDTGIGISPEDQNIIFDEFRQVSEGFSRSFEGTGLGLTLTKRFVEKLNGEISVSSKLGEGSVFTVRLPDAARRITPVQETEPLPVDESPVPVQTDTVTGISSILLVENDAINAEVIGYFMNNRYNYDIVLNGEDALEMARQKQYDLFLMDINLGQGLSGIEVTKQLRQMDKYRTAPVIAITAFAMKGDREEFIEAGCTDYLAKPFSRSDLLEKIKQVAEK